MRVFRLSKRKYAEVLNGKGAARSNNRWNSKGVEMVYAAESRALAMAEVGVHLSWAILPRDYVMVEIEIPGVLKIEDVDASLLDDGWDGFPYLKQTQSLGDKFIEAGSTCVLKVPSAVVKGDFNFLLNPAHPDMKKIGIVGVSDFLFDKRLFQSVWARE